NAEVLGAIAEEFEPVRLPTHLPDVPAAVDQPGNRLAFPGLAVGRRVHRGSGRPLAVSVPLEDVDLAVRQRILVDRPERRPQAGEQAVEFDPRFPGGADHAPPVAAQLAAVVGAHLLGGTQHEIGIAVLEYVAAVVAIDALA